MRRPVLNLPDVPIGEACTPGQSYKIDCNHCLCTSFAQLVCTRKACLKPGFGKILIKTPAGKNLDRKPIITNKPCSSCNITIEAKNVNIIVTKADDINGIHEEERSSQQEERISTNLQLKGKDKSKRKTLPNLPKGKCVAGRIYKSHCRRCFCDQRGKSKCSQKADACSIQGRTSSIKSPEDVRQPFVREELKNVKVITTTSDKCDPGETYQLSCNLCVCLERGNLLCSTELCLSYHDINRVEAKKKSGGECTEDPNPSKVGCIECKCVNKVLKCTEVPNCSGATRATLSLGGKQDVKIKLNAKTDTCVPNAIYMDKCNRCYCQPDSTLRCTRKNCLLYTQAQTLLKQLQKYEDEMNKGNEKNPP